jgi:hypothetical protein
MIWECVSLCFRLPLRIRNQAESPPRRDVYSNVEISDEVLARF